MKFLNFDIDHCPREEFRQCSHLLDGEIRDIVSSRTRELPYWFLNLSHQSCFCESVYMVAEIVISFLDGHQIIVAILDMNFLYVLSEEFEVRLAKLVIKPEGREINQRKRFPSYLLGNSLHRNLSLVVWVSNCDKYMLT